MQALKELLPARQRVPAGVLRVFASVEVVAAVTVVFWPTRLVGAVLLAVVGVSIAIAGATGAIRKTQLSCGCFGGTGSAPLGLRNTAVGALIASTLTFNLLGGVAQQSAYEYSGLAISLLAGGAIAVTLFAHRRLALMLKHELDPSIAP
jgi:Methylamine utilisation protein MauE